MNNLCAKNTLLSPSQLLSKKKILICGGHGSTGTQAVKFLRELGATPIVLDIHPSENIKYSVERPIDLKNSMEVENRFREIREVFTNGIDGCICLTTPPVFEDLNDLTLANFSERIKNIELSFADTFWSVFNPMLATAVLMKEMGQGGNIIVASSVNALIAGGCYGYDGAKSALIPEIANVNKKFSQYGIYCYQMLLGTIGDTENWDSEDGKKWLEKVRNDIPDGKLITTQDVVQLIAMILTGNLTILSGSPIICDKSWLMTRGLN
jgi:NAD(P)-dependent dehydrogenase (short-subunit alcohol dehydrogenase family)